jgi:pimeloyl-ACP methyl ester carboxylesterase
MICFHGIGDDLSELQHEFNYIRRRCQLNVLGVEYPGFGLNWDHGICTEERMIRDAKAVLKFIHSELKIEFEDIILWGRSIGTGVVAQLAKSMLTPPALLILQ